MDTEKRLFDFAIWLVALSVLLAILTSCNPYEELQTATTTTQPTKVPPAGQSPTPHTCTVTTGVPAGYLNLRTGEGTSYAVIRVLNEGETLTVITRGAWHEVTDAQGNHGYINSRYCK